MIYRVMRSYQRGSESAVGTFKTINEAKIFIQEKLTDDAILKVNATYRIYEGMDLMEEFDQSKLIKQDSSQDSSDSSSQQRGSGQTFTPTPFNMTPQPKGLPRNWIKEEDNKEDDKK